MKKSVIAISLLAALALVGTTGCKSEEQIRESTSAQTVTSEVVLKQQNAEAQNVIKVSGSGEVILSPEIAVTTLGVTTLKEDASEAETENSETMTKVIEAVKALGVDEEDIKSSYFSVYPTYDYSGETETLTGFRVTNEIEITVRSIDSVGEILSAAVAAGANEVGTISFCLDDTSEAYLNALSAAVADAIKKAEALSEAVGAKLNTVPISVTETSTSQTPMNYANYEEAYVADNADGDTAANSSVPVSSGDLSVEAQVEMEFQLQTEENGNS